MGCWRRKKIIKTVEIWFYLGRGMCWEEDGDEDDGRWANTEQAGVKVPYSVLLLFTAPGSFSCNLKERQKTPKGKCEKKETGPVEDSDDEDAAHSLTWPSLCWLECVPSQYTYQFGSGRKKGLKKTSQLFWKEDLIQTN